MTHNSYAEAANDIADDEENECECIKRSSTPERPNVIPYEPVPENIDKLKKWLVDAFSANAFNTCTHQKLQKMEGTPCDIKFKEGSTAYAVHTPILVAIHWKKKVKEDIDRDVRLGIMELVPQGTPNKVVFTNGGS